MATALRSFGRIDGYLTDAEIDRIGLLMRRKRRRYAQVNCSAYQPKGRLTVRGARGACFGTIERDENSPYRYFDCTQ